MGSVYLIELPEVLDAAGLDVVVIDGYATRSRSTGGYDPAIPAPVALFVHHTAGGLLSGNLAGALHGALAHESKPIDNFRLGRNCTIYADAAGASNTEGQGGPWGPLLPGPGNYANPRAIGLECDNNGIGEPWSDDLQDTLLLFCITVYVYGVRHWGWEASVPAHRLGAHFEWAPTRKIDPAGPSRWMRADDRYMRWDMDRFRADVRAGVAAALAPPKPDPEPEPIDPTEPIDTVEDTDMQLIDKDYGKPTWARVAIAGGRLKWIRGRADTLVNRLVAGGKIPAPEQASHDEFVDLMRTIGTEGPSPFDPAQTGSVPDSALDAEWKRASRN